MPVGEMAAMREIHRQNLVARFEHRKIDRHVRLGAAVRLHIDVIAAEKSLGAIDRELLGNIDIFAPAIPAFPRIAFGIFVRQAAALSLHHRATGEILGGDKLDVFALPFFLRLDGIENFGIDTAQALHHNRQPMSMRWSGVDGLRKITHNRRTARCGDAPGRHEFALFYKCEHAR